MSRVKRVRFADPDTVYPPSCKPDASSIPAKGRDAQRFDDPKTSEYAFYKKLREGTGRSFHSYNQDNRLKRFQASDCIGEVTHMVKHNCKEVRTIRSLLPIEMVTPINLRSSPSPVRASKNSGPQYRDEELFSKTRQKLCQWVAEASSLEVHECCSNGYDLVSVLLQRLVPESSARKSCVDLSSSYKKSNARSQLLSSPDSDVYFGKLPWTPSMNFMEPVAIQYLEGGLSECGSKKSRELVHSQWDGVNSDSLLAGNANKFHFQYRRKDPYCFLDDGETTVLHTKMEPAFSTDMGKELSLKGYGSLALDHLPMQSKSDDFSYENLPSHWHFPNQSLGPSINLRFKELNESHDPNEPALGMERHTQFLGWDDNASHNTVVNSSPVRTTLFGDDHRRSLTSEFDERHKFLGWDDNASHNTLVNSSPIRTTLFGNDHRRSLTSEFDEKHKFLGWDDDASHNTVVNLSPIRTTLFGDDHRRSLTSEFDERHTQFLGWNDTASHNTVMNSNPVRTTLFGDDHQRSLTSKFDAAGLSSSSVLASCHSPNVTSLSDFCSKKSQEERDYSVGLLDHFPLTFLSCSQGYLAEGCRLIENYEGSNLFNYPHSHQSFMSHIFKEKLCPSFNAHILPSGLDFDFGWKKLLINDSFGEHHSLTSPDLQFFEKETQNVSSFMLTGEKTRWCLNNSSQTETQSQLAEDIFSIHDLSSLSFRISLNSFLFDNQAGMDLKDKYLDTTEDKYS